MAEFPAANSPDFDPLASPKGVLTPWKRARSWTIIVTMYVVFLGMAAGAVPLLRTAFGPGVALEDRLMHLLWAGLLLLPVGIVVRHFVRVRLKTGLWRGTPEQRREEKLARVAQCSINRTKPGFAGNEKSLLSYAVKWASYTAFQPDCTAGQRAAAWLVLAGYTLAVVGVAAIGLICSGAAFADDNTLTATLLFIALGVAALIWPGMVIRRLIRGIRAGKVGTTREELESLRAQHTAWRMREGAKPLRTKLINTGVAIAIYAFWWIGATVRHAHHPHINWVTPAMATPFLLYTIWIQFRPGRTTPSKN